MAGAIFKFSPEVICKTLYKVGRPWKDSVNGIDSFPQEHLSGVYHNEQFLKQIEAEDETINLLLKNNLFPENPEDSSEEWDRNKRHFDSGAMKHVPICEIQFSIVKLTNRVYEYRPSYYEEISCVHKEFDQGVKNQFCSAIGLSCVTRNKTLHFARRKYESDCWEPKTMVIPAGCECMWPVHMLGTLNFEPLISL